MQDKQLTPAQAWNDFYSFIQLPENWNPLSRETKHYLRKTARQMPSGEVGAKRICQILDKFAPGRYQFHEKVWITKNTL